MPVKKILTLITLSAGSRGTLGVILKIALQIERDENTNIIRRVKKWI